MKFLLIIASLIAIALVVYIAGETALSNSPMLALLPVATLLIVILLYIRYQDKQWPIVSSYSIETIGVLVVI